MSMGTIAARQAGEIGRNVRRVLAMELMVACQEMCIRDSFKGQDDPVKIRERRKGALLQLHGGGA